MAYGQPLIVRDQDEIDRIAHGLELLAVQDLGQLALSLANPEIDKTTDEYKDDLAANEEYNRGTLALLRRIRDEYQTPPGYEKVNPRDDQISEVLGDSIENGSKIK